MPGVFARVTCLCVCGAIYIWDGDVGVDKVWLVFSGMGEIFSLVVSKNSSCCNASLWRPWNVWFYFLIL